MQNNIKVIIAEDEELFARGMALLLKEEGKYEITATVKNGDELMAAIQNGLRPDLVILDIHMGDNNMDGAKAAAALRKVHKNVKILVLTKHDEPEYVKALIRLDVDGYVLKKYTHEELIEAIDTVMNPKGRKYFPSEIMQIFLQEESRKLLEPVKLTPREIEITKLICCEAKRTSEIATQLIISENAVEKHRSNIFAKLNITNVVELVIYAIANGICVVPVPDRK